MFYNIWGFIFLFICLMVYGVFFSTPQTIVAHGGNGNNITFNSGETYYFFVDGWNILAKFVEQETGSPYVMLSDNQESSKKFWHIFKNICASFSKTAAYYKSKYKCDLQFNIVVKNTDFYMHNKNLYLPLAQRTFVTDEETAMIAIYDNNKIHKKSDEESTFQDYIHYIASYFKNLRFCSVICQSDAKTFEQFQLATGSRESDDVSLLYLAIKKLSEAGSAEARKKIFILSEDSYNFDWLNKPSYYMPRLKYYISHNTTPNKAYFKEFMFNIKTPSQTGGGKIKKLKISSKDPIKDELDRFIEESENSKTLDIKKMMSLYEKNTYALSLKNERRGVALFKLEPVICKSWSRFKQSSRNSTLNISGFIKDHYLPARCSLRE